MENKMETTISLWAKQEDLSASLVSGTPASGSLVPIADSDM